MPRRPPRRPTDRWKGTKPSFFRVRPPTPDVASTMFAILAIFFSAPTHALEHPAYRGVADLHAGRPPQELTPLRQCCRRSLPEVRFQQLPRRLVELGLRSGVLFRREGSSLARYGGVALDRGDAHTEGLGDLGGGYAPFFGFDDLLPQVQRVGIHGHILPRRPTALQDALADACDASSGSQSLERSAARYGCCRSVASQTLVCP